MGYFSFERFVWHVGAKSDEIGMDFDSYTLVCSIVSADAGYMKCSISGNDVGASPSVRPTKTRVIRAPLQHFTSKEEAAARAKTVEKSLPW